MRCSRRCRSLTLWLAGLAMLLGTLAPTLSHAMAERGDDVSAEICSAAGTQRIASQGETDAPAPMAMSVLDHCPFCALQHTLPALPQAEPAGVPEPAAVAAWPPLFLAASEGLFAWTCAQPRGPPLIS